MKKLVLSSPVQFAKLIESNPDLLNIPNLASLRNIIEAVNKKGCSSCQRRTGKPSHTAKTQIEGVLSNLTSSDYLTMKALLKMDKICYYHNVNGKTEQTCI